MSDYKLKLIGEDIDTTLLNSATSCQLVSTDSQVRLVFTNDVTSKSYAVDIPSVTTGRAGIVTSAYYRELESLKSSMTSMSSITSATAQYTDSDVTLNFGKFSVPITRATDTKAGLMATDDVKVVSSAARLFEVSPATSVGTTSMMPPVNARGGEVVFDTSAKRLLLRIGSTYYEAWQDQNNSDGVDSNDYKSKRVMVYVGNTLYSWNGVSWQEVTSNKNEETLGDVIIPMEWVGEVSVEKISYSVGMLINADSFCIGKDKLLGNVYVFYRVGGKYYMNWMADSPNSVEEMYAQTKIYSSNGILYQGTGTNIGGLTIFGGSKFAPVIMPQDDYDALTDEQKESIYLAMTY